MKRRLVTYPREVRDHIHEIFMLANDFTVEELEPGEGPDRALHRFRISRGGFFPVYMHEWQDPFDPMPFVTLTHHEWGNTGPEADRLRKRIEDLLIEHGATVRVVES